MDNIYIPSVKRSADIIDNYIVILDEVAKWLKFNSWEEYNGCCVNDPNEVEKRLREASIDD